jgi:hypothetical protein
VILALARVQPVAHAEGGLNVERLDNFAVRARFAELA